MKNIISKTIFAYLFVFVALILFFIGCNNHINEDLTSVSPKKVYTANSLISEFNSKDDVEKEIVIAVEGVVHEVNTINDRWTILLEGKTPNGSYIICDMNFNQIKAIETVKSGDSILIKGILKGILKDVIMLNCIIVNTK